MRSRHRSILAQYNKFTASENVRRTSVVSLLSALAVTSVFACLVACGGDEEGGTFVNASSSGYTPATPPTMPQLPPGAGPRDAGVIPQPPMDSGTVMDAATKPDAPTMTDAAVTDAPPG